MMATPGLASVLSNISNILTTSQTNLPWDAKKHASQQGNHEQFSTCRNGKFETCRCRAFCAWRSLRADQGGPSGPPSASAFLPSWPLAVHWPPSQLRHLNPQYCSRSGAVGKRFLNGDQATDRHATSVSCRQNDSRPTGIAGSSTQMAEAFSPQNVRTALPGMLLRQDPSASDRRAGFDD